MKMAEKQAKQTQLQSEAKDLQARLGFAALQKENAEKEISKIRTILEYQEAQFAQLNQTEVESEETKAE